jgi:hypothetical protein
LISSALSATASVVKGFNSAVLFRDTVVKGFNSALFYRDTGWCSSR